MSKLKGVLEEECKYNEIVYTFSLVARARASNLAYYNGATVV